jgi:hypothetical protein
LADAFGSFPTANYTGSKKPASFKRAENPIYVLQLGGEGWIGPTALTNLGY